MGAFIDSIKANQEVFELDESGVYEDLIGAFHAGLILLGVTLLSIIVVMVGWGLTPLTTILTFPAVFFILFSVALRIFIDKWEMRVLHAANDSSEDELPEAEPIYTPLPVIEAILEPLNHNS